ncbi:uncharacterized protein LOC143229142 [Tachypleus tridentatus]|uniref:uncharacterized protein LOC143229142 n=1 Tax=Tachypleus tridentatus TaxID=6853 RepID=UPI003FD4F2A9
MSIKNTMVNGYKKKLRLVSFAICYIIWQFSLPSGMAAHEWDLKMIGDACSSDKECADLFSVCASGICSCDTAYHKIHFFSACNDERKLGDLCTSDKDCTIPHSYCFMNSCVCKSGYVKELLSTEYSCTKYGERAFNEECSTDEECPPLDASCSNGICSCNPGYRKEYFHGYFFCIRAENHDVTTLETDSSATFEHLKLGFSKWPFIAAIVVALLILAICIYFCLRCRRRNQQQQPQPAVNYQSCPQASGGPVISGVSSQQVNYPPYPVTPGYPGYGGPTPTSGHGGPLPAGGYFPSGAQGYYGPLNLENTMGTHQCLHMQTTVTLPRQNSFSLIPQSQDPHYMGTPLKWVITCVHLILLDILNTFKSLYLSLLQEAVTQQVHPLLHLLFSHQLLLIMETTDRTHYHLIIQLKALNQFNQSERAKC